MACASVSCRATSIPAAAAARAIEVPRSPVPTTTRLPSRAADGSGIDLRPCAGHTAHEPHSIERDDVLRFGARLERNLEAEPADSHRHDDLGRPAEDVSLISYSSVEIATAPEGSGRTTAGPSAFLGKRPQKAQFSSSTD